MATVKKRIKRTDAPAPACVHKYAATGGKTSWIVQAFPINNRGGPKKVEVPVTVFKCMSCGEKKEFPDTWESNYVAPEPTPIKTRPQKAAIKRKTKNA